MNNSTAAHWPTARLDRIAQLKVRAAALPGVALVETVIDAPFEHTWERITDLERAVPFYDSDVAWLRIVRREGDPDGTQRLRIVTRQTAQVLWLPAMLDMELSPGWCWMVTKPHAYVIGMAAEPTPDNRRTRLAFLEGVAVPAPQLLQPLLRPIYALSRWRHRHHIPHDIAEMKRFVAT